MKQLQQIQQQLKAPKGQYNTFGKYKYRSCEDILESVKPILAAADCTLTLSDEIICLGERFYIKATATLTNSSGEAVSTTAFAREEETKKGMDASQITGTASSYARKYALNGLFCIDDTKDADALNTSESYTAKAKVPANDAALEQAIFDLNESSDRTSFEQAWARHPEYHKNDTFRASAAKVGMRFPKTA